MSQMKLHGKNVKDASVHCRISSVVCPISFRQMEMAAVVKERKVGWEKKRKTTA